jgi:hypothetical protein
VVTPNGLFGSMGLNGMAVLLAARTAHPDLLITETHPKVLCHELSEDKYDYKNHKSAMDMTLSRVLGVTIEPANDHEWDAALSAFAAFKGAMGHWTRDLHSLPLQQNERLVQPCGETHYFWPE